MADSGSSEVQYLCPHTNMLLRTGIQRDARSLTEAWNRPMHLQCPHCGMTHHFKIRDIFLEQALRPRETMTVGPGR